MSMLALKRGREPAAQHVAPSAHVLNLVELVLHCHVEAVVGQLHRCVVVLQGLLEDHDEAMKMSADRLNMAVQYKFDQVLEHMHAGSDVLFI